MTNVMKTIDFNQQGIKLTYQYNPLSWHFYSFKIHQGTSLFNSKLSSLSKKMLDPSKQRSSFPTFLPIRTLLLRNNGLTKQWENFWTGLQTLWDQFSYQFHLFFRKLTKRLLEILLMDHKHGMTEGIIGNTLLDRISSPEHHFSI